MRHFRGCGAVHDFSGRQACAPTPHPRPLYRYASLLTLLPEVFSMRPDRDLTRTYSRKQFAEKLRRLADAIEKEGAFTIQVAGERLRIPADATFNIEHEREGEDEELEFQVIWSRK